MSDDRKDLDTLDAAFARLRAEEKPPSRDFLARLLADAAEAMPAQAPPAPRQTRRDWLSGMLDGLGGWRCGMALTASALVGMMVGYSGMVDSIAADGLVGEVALYDGYSGFADDAEPEG